MCGERRGTVRTEFWWSHQRERDHLEDTGVDGWIIFKKCGGGKNWIDLAHNSDGCRAVVNAVMNLWVPITRGIYWLA
jgi:hypothetical protein